MRLHLRERISSPVKSYLLQHTALLTKFTRDFRSSSNRYYASAKAVGFDYDELVKTKRASVARELAQAKALWIRGNPYYERVEGIVAGTPSLAVYDVILDAGSSAKEDPASAVPFDLKLRNGRVLRKPGNLYNLTEGMLWGTRPELVAAKVDLDGDGKIEFGEVLPDANVLTAAADAFVLYGAKLDRSAKAWQPTASDAFTSVVVMVPTMSEYFGQWKVSRFVLGDSANGDSFNVVSRLSDIGDILGGLGSSTTGSGRRSRRSMRNSMHRRSASSTRSGSTSRSSRPRSTAASASRRSRQTRSGARHRSAPPQSPDR